MRMIGRDQIEAVLESVDLIGAMEKAFLAFSAGTVQLAKVGELRLLRPPGDVHIKAGHVEGGAAFLVKIASGFYENPRSGLASSSGLSLLFDAKTGMVQTLLLDEGRLTDERTAAAGAVAAKWLARKDANTIAVIGAGIQARLQLKHLKSVTDARKAVIWSPSQSSRDACVAAARALGFEASSAETPAAAARGADIIVTATPATSPLLEAADIAKGAHITAIGADAVHKGELFEDLLLRADLVVADSLVQCKERGELRRIWRRAEGVFELGALISGQKTGRTHGDQITIADLTGLAVQDIFIAEAVMDLIDRGDPHA